MLKDKDIMPIGPHAGKRMHQVPVEWLEHFACNHRAWTSVDADDVLEYIRANRVRIDKMLDAQEHHVS